MKGQLNIPVLIGLLLTIIIGLTVAWSVADSLRHDFIDVLWTHNESMTISANYTTNDLSNTKVISGTITLQNTSNTLTEGVEYNTSINSNGVGTIGWQEVLFTAVNATYSHAPSSYVNQTTTRTIINQIPLLILVVVIIVIAGAMLVRR